MSAERLQKVLARAGIGSRRGIEEMIREGRITVNGRIAQLGDRADLESDAVKVDGRRVQAAASRRYLLLNKPSGCVSTVSDPEGRATVVDLLPHRLRAGLKPVGRLDFETEGLLLLTDDGEWAHRISHPRFGCPKSYEVKVKGRPTTEDLERLRGGILLDGKRTSPAEISERSGHPGAKRGGSGFRREATANSWWVVTISEGRTRQVREMFFRIGNPVQRLRRVAIGPLRDARLPRGGWRELTEREVEQLRKAGPVAPAGKGRRQGGGKRGGTKRPPRPHSKGRSSRSRGRKPSRQGTASRRPNKPAK